MSRTLAITRKLRSHALSLGLMLVAAPAWAAEGDPWADGSTWVSLRAGYAKSVAEGAANGIGGYGFGFTHFISPRWAIGGHAHHELLGRFGSSSEIAIPLTAEITRHFKWATVLRPYLGLGGGVFFHKTYRTGSDRTETRNGGYLSGGFNSPITNYSLLGVDARMAVVSNAESINPVFPSTRGSATFWSIKLNYARYF